MLSSLLEQEALRVCEVSGFPAGSVGVREQLRDSPLRADCSRRLFLGLGAMALLAGCASRSSPSSALEKAPRARVGRYASPNPGSVNTLWLSAPEGLIVVDSGRNITGGQLAVKQLARKSLPVSAILVTHPHPDHIAGLGVLHKAFPRAPIFASKATTKWMRTDPLGFYPLARRDDPNFPAKLTYPDHMI